MAGATVVPDAAAIPLPDGVDPAVAALIGCCVTTGVGAVLKTAEVPAGASVAVIGLGGVGLSCVMGAVLAGAARIVAIDRVAAKLEVAREVGATDGSWSPGDPARDVAALRDLTDGGPDYVFEAIGRTATVELAIESLPVGGTAVLVGMTPVGARASFAVYPFVDGSRRILGSNYGFAVPAVDFPRYAQLHLAGRLPVDRLIDRRIGLDELEAGFDRLRAGDGPPPGGHFLTPTDRASTLSTSPHSWTRRRTHRRLVRASVLEAAPGARVRRRRVPTRFIGRHHHALRGHRDARRDRALERGTG